MNLIRNFFNDESGAELAEYAVACAIVVAIAIIAYQFLADAINAKMDQVTSELEAPPADPSEAPAP